MAGAATLLSPQEANDRTKYRCFQCTVVRTGLAPSEVMNGAGLIHWSFSHFLSDHFPDLGHPRYQSTLEKLSFILVASMLVGTLIASLALVVYEL